MREERSPSNILFGFLPGQTVDLQRGVWRVAEWRSPGHSPCRDSALREEIIRQAMPWSRAGNDGGFVNDLRSNLPIEMVELSSAGVGVERFPRTYRCKACMRLSNNQSDCRCGKRDWGQLHFVAYHDCGVMEEPMFPRCPQHQQIRMVNPGTSAVHELRFECPVCDRLIQKGFGFRRCACGNGSMKHTVHRAASVFTPRTAVVVNAADSEVRELLQQSGGSGQALSWVLGGIATRDFRSLPHTPESMLQTLLKQGVPKEFAELTVQQMVAADKLAPRKDENGWHAAEPEVAEQQAVSIATALFSGRVTIADLDCGASQDKERIARYRDSLRTAGLAGVDLVDRFPVLTAVYGFTRGDMSAGGSTLVPFQFAGKNGFAAYVDRTETEALFFRLDPLLVHGWLAQQGFDLPKADDAESARKAILTNVRMPIPGSTKCSPPSLGDAVLTLVHSYSHRVIRKLPVLAGVDRDSLSEFLVPAHLGFFVYAAAKGSFVLGGLQAMFENDLDHLLEQVCYAEHRCAMDPGCESSGAACACCLHIGEPSCRLYNRFLDRRSLHGGGYIHFAMRDSKNIE